MCQFQEQEKTHIYYNNENNKSAVSSLFFTFQIYFMIDPNLSSTKNYNSQGFIFQDRFYFSRGC